MWCLGMIVLLTDYGFTGPYNGQLEIVLKSKVPEEAVVNLCADVPRQNPRAGAYLLAALKKSLPQPDIWLCVVDPGVGTWVDAPVMINIDGSWFVGPDNGLFELVARRAVQRTCYRIIWRPERISSSFHGRDLYAPVAAELARGHRPASELYEWQSITDWPDDLNEIIYLDSFGNAVTGIRASTLDTSARLFINGTSLNHAITFGDVNEGQGFWYENSIGLVEIAVNCGNASDAFGIDIGASFVVYSPDHNNDSD